MVSDRYVDEPFEDEESNEDTSDLNLTTEDFSELIVAPADWTVETIYSQIGKQIDLDPDFQRRNVWSLAAKSRFIESLLLGIPIPQILLSDKQGKKGAYIVLDGKQRLLTILEFMRGTMTDGKKFRLKDLRILKELNGQDYTKLSLDFGMRDRLHNETVRTTIVKNWGKQSVLYEIFYRLNTGSVRLSPMELRMSLYPGGFLKFVIAWSEKVGPLHHLLRRKSADPRMADVELAVRHLAFKSDQQYDGNLKLFLDSYCDAINKDFENLSDGITSKLAGMNSAIECGMKVFTENRFCKKFGETGYESRFNRAVFDVMVGSLAVPDFKTFAEENPQKVKDAYEKLCLSDREFIRSIETSTKNVEPTTTRFKAWYDVVRVISNVNIPMPNIVVR